MSVRGDICWRHISFIGFPLDTADVLHMTRSDVLPQGMQHLLQNVYGGALEDLFHS